jgi:hypothetical protein
MTEREMAEAKQHANEAAEIVREEIDRFMIENGRTLENLGSLAAHRNIHVKMER